MIFLARVKEVVRERWYLIIAEDDVSALKKIKDFWAISEVISIGCLAKPAKLPGEEVDPCVHELVYEVARPFVEQYSRYVDWVDKQASVVKKTHRHIISRKRRHRR